MDCDCPDLSNCPKCKENCPPPPKKSLSLKGKQKKPAAVPAETQEDEDRFRFLTDEQHVNSRKGTYPRTPRKILNEPYLTSSHGNKRVKDLDLSLVLTIC